MKIFEMIVSIVFYVFSIYVDLRYIKLFLRPKENCSKVLKSICAVCVVLNWLSFCFVQIPIITTLSAFFAIFIITNTNYKGSILEKVLAVGLSMALGVVAEGIVFRFLNWINGKDINSTLGVILSNFLLLVVVSTLEKSKKFDGEARLTWGSYFNMIVVSVGSAILAELMLSASFFSNETALLGLCIICIINIGTYYMYEKVYDAYKEKMKKVVLEKQIVMYQNQFEIIHASRQEMKQLRHDMKNHLLLMESYLQKEKYAEAQEYIGKMVQRATLLKEYANTGNDELDSILNYHLERAENLHCETVIEIEVPEERFMSDFDLNMLLSNLMDNAVEALERTEERVLAIRIKYIKRVLYISLHNSYDGKVKREENKLLTTKIKKEGHGIGMTCIRSIVEKYQGEMTVQTVEDMFKVDIILYV